MRAPCMMVDRMSRPWLSVPSRKARSPPSTQAGGLNAAFRSSAAASNGSCGESQGENIAAPTQTSVRSEEHTSELQSPCNLVCRLLLEKKKKKCITVTVPLASNGNGDFDND